MRRDVQPPTNQREKHDIHQVPTQHIIRDGESEKPICESRPERALDRGHGLREAVRRAKRSPVGRGRTQVHEHGAWQYRRGDQRGRTPREGHLIAEKRLTIAHLGDAQRRELYQNQRPCVVNGRASQQVLEWEHGVDHGEHGDAGNEYRPRAKPRDCAREDGELKHAIHAPINRQPDPDPSRAHVESAKLDRG